MGLDIMRVSIPVLALFLGLLTAGFTSPASRPEDAQSRDMDSGEKSAESLESMESPETMESPESVESSESMESPESGESPEYIESSESFASSEYTDYRTVNVPNGLLIGLK